MDLRELREKRRSDFEYERLRKREEIKEGRLEDRARREQEKRDRDERISHDRERRDKKLKEIKEREDERYNKKKCSCKNCWKLWGGGKVNDDDFLHEIIKELCERKNGGSCKKYKKKQKGGDMRNIHDRIETCINKPCDTNIYGEEGCIPLTIGKMKDYHRIMNISNPIKRTNALHEYEKAYCNQLFGGGGVTLNGNETGGGVVLIENYLNRNHTRQEDAVILFRDKFTGKYNDGGGKIDPGETVERAARRELKEESENLFRLSPNSLNLQLASRHQNYIAYFVRITAKGGIQSKYYSSNLSALKKGNAAHHWVETDKMTRVYVKDLINNNISSVKGDFKVNDANGNPITIEGKTKAVLREGLNNNIINMTYPQTLNLNPNCKDNENPHISTVCYYT